MQTFLPYPNYAQSAACLDRQRLGKQRVECLQILNTLAGKSDGWKNHPAVKMWANREGSLAAYMYAIMAEWSQRGYKNNITLPVVIRTDVNYRLPSWLGDPAFHASHRSNLLRKLPSHYSQFGWTEPNDLPYIWPT